MYVHATVHLASVTDVVIVEGLIAGENSDRKVLDAYNAKYDCDGRHSRRTADEPRRFRSPSMVIRPLSTQSPRSTTKIVGSYAVRTSS